MLPILLTCALVVLAPAASATPSFDVAEKSMTELRSALEAGTVTSRRLVELYRERIARLDRRGPRLNAVAELNPDALAIADALDAERRAGKVRGPLHGIPILIKDNIDTGDRMHTTGGSLALASFQAKADAFVVTRLRAAGAILLGKTNLTEFANFVSSKMPSGYSARAGQVRNPYGRKLDPCGSSAGSGAAAAASLAAATVGTETSGSIICPAVYQSLVGIKPTLGLISRTGIIPIAHSQDTAGPMARSVADAAILLGAMTGVDPADPATAASAKKALTDYTPHLNPDGLQGARIGVPRQGFFKEYRGEEGSLKLIAPVLERLKTLGATVVDPANVPTATQVDKLSSRVLEYEFKTDLKAYLARQGDRAPVHSLAEVIAFNRSHPKQELRYGQDVFLAAERIAHNRKDELAYQKARREDIRLSRTEGLDAAFSRYDLDALAVPMVNGSDIAARAGYPSITVPVGYLKNGQPVGITLIGRAWSEARLIELAYALERALAARKAPLGYP